MSYVRDKENTVSLYTILVKALKKYMIIVVYSFIVYNDNKMPSVPCPNNHHGTLQNRTSTQAMCNAAPPVQYIAEYIENQTPLRRHTQHTSDTPTLTHTDTDTHNTHTQKHTFQPH